MDKITETKEYQEEDALSLSDFPLQNTADDKSHSHKTQDKRRSSSEPSEFFEFFTSDFTANNMSHAEDIIFRGKLVPFRNHHHHFLKSLSADDATRFSRRTTTVRSNSLSSARPRRYLDEKTLRRRDRTRSDVAGRSLSKRCSRSEGSQPSKPKWFVLMFGPLKLHPEMDLREMKSRGGRQAGSIFPSYKEGAAGRSGRRSLWGFDLLRVLSCKSRTSAAVTTSVGLAPRF